MNLWRSTGARSSAARRSPPGLVVARARWYPSRAGDSVPLSGRATMRLWAVFVGLLALAGCGRRGEQPAACVPGAVVVCPCSGAPVGSQTCQPNGTFGACACPTVPAVAAQQDNPDKPPPVVAQVDTPAPVAAPMAAAVRAAPTAPVAPVARVQPRAAPATPPLNPCGGATDCGSCAARPLCAWCGAENRCVYVPSNSCSGPEFRSCASGWACRPNECTTVQTAHTDNEPNTGVCASHHYCRQCAVGEGCAWCAPTAVCRDRNSAEAADCPTYWTTSVNDCRM